MIVVLFIAVLVLSCLLAWSASIVYRLAQACMSLQNQIDALRIDREFLCEQIIDIRGDLNAVRFEIDASTNLVDL